jgi:hypothetical protein
VRLIVAARNLISRACATDVNGATAGGMMGEHWWEKGWVIALTLGGLLEPWPREGVQSDTVVPCIDRCTEIDARGFSKRDDEAGETSKSWFPSNQFPGLAPRAAPAPR